MGRKRIRDLDSYKFSLDINGENKKALDCLTCNLDLKYGPIINHLISLFCCMPNNIKDSFLDFCILRCEELMKQQNVSGVMEKEEIKKEILLTGC